MNGICHHALVLDLLDLITPNPLYMNSTEPLGQDGIQPEDWERITEKEALLIEADDIEELKEYRAATATNNECVFPTIQTSFERRELLRCLHEPRRDTNGS